MCTLYKDVYTSYTYVLQQLLSHTASNFHMCEIYFLIRTITKAFLRGEGGRFSYIRVLPRTRTYDSYRVSQKSGTLYILFKRQSICKECIIIS